MKEVLAAALAAWRAGAGKRHDRHQRTLYLTTPIYYVNDVPHVGHAYTTIAADALTRARKLAGHDAFLLTGTDEHGQNIERIARERGISEQQHCDEIAAKFRELWGRYDIRYDRFIRTTDEIHKRGVLQLWEKLRVGEDARRPGRRLPRHVRRLVLPALRGLQGRGRAAPARQHLSRPRAARASGPRRRTSSSGSRPTRGG